MKLESVCVYSEGISPDIPLKMSKIAMTEYEIGTIFLKEKKRLFLTKPKPKLAKNMSGNVPKPNNSM